MRQTTVGFGRDLRAPIEQESASLGLNVVRHVRESALAGPARNALRAQSGPARERAGVAGTGAERPRRRRGERHSR